MREMWGILMKEKLERRNILFQDRGELLLLKFIERLSELGTAEMLPKLEGNRMMTIINPKSAKQPKKH